MPAPLLKRFAPCTILPLHFLIFQSPPSLREVIKIYSSPFKNFITYSITYFLVLNNNPVLNGEIKFTCVYSLTPNPLYTLWIKNGIDHTVCQSNMKLLFLPLNVTGVLPRLKFANKWEVYKISSGSNPPINKRRWVS